MSTILPEGNHKFSGIEPFQYQDEYGQNHDGYYVIIDDVVYAFEINHDDGWRSYGEIYIPEKITVHDIKNRFPAQEVIIMQYHGKHIDGNKQNHQLSNLQMLCPNCHSITDNFKSKNIKHYKIT